MIEMKTGIPWKRYSSEGVIIVLSILLAFGVDAWWDRLEQKGYQDELLSRIESALIENVKLVDARIEGASRIEEPLYSFLEMDSGAFGIISNTRTRLIIDTLIKPYTSTFNNDNLLSLFSNENSTLALDADLQDSIAVWRKQMNSVAVIREQLIWVEREVAKALGNSPEIRPFMGSYDIDTLTVSAGAEAIRAAIDNSEAMSLANAKLMYLGIYANALTNLKRESESLQSIVSSLVK